jgi:ribosomal protein L31
LYSMPRQALSYIARYLILRKEKTWCHPSVPPVKTDLAIYRICQDLDKTENLKVLCQCTGSIAKYHVLSCLEKWLSVSKIDICELCHQHFTTKRKSRPFSEVCNTFKQG